MMAAGVERARSRIGFLRAGDDEGIHFAEQGQPRTRFRAGEIRAQPRYGLSLPDIQTESAQGFRRQRGSFEFAEARFRIFPYGFRDPCDRIGVCINGFRDGLFQFFQTSHAALLSLNLQ